MAEQLSVNLALKTSSAKEQVKNINSEIRLLKSEFEKASDGTKEFEKSQEGMAQKLKLNKGVLEQTEKKLKVYEDKLQECNKTLEEASKKYKENEAKVKSNREALEKGITTYGKNSEEVKTLKAELDKSEKAFESSRKAVISSDNSLKTMQVTVNKTSAEINKIKNDINKTETEFKELKSDVDKSEISMNGFKTGVMKVTDEVKVLGKELDKSGKDTEELGKSMTNTKGKSMELGAQMVIVGEGIGKVGEVALSTGKDILEGLGAFAEVGADAEEMSSKFDTVFGDMSADVKAWASDYSNAVGRNKYDIMNFLANQSDLAIGMGMTREQATTLSKSYVELALDLASFNNVNDATAFEAMGKAMMGETEMMKQLGVNLSVATMENSEYVKGLGKKFSALTQSEKAEAYYAEMIKQSTNAIGDAERTSDSYTNSLKGVKAKKEEMAVAIGSTLIPILTPFIAQIGEIVQALATWIEENPELTRTLIIIAGVIGLLLTVLGAVLVPLGLVIVAIVGVELVGLPLIATIGGIVLAITLLIAAIGFVIAKWDEIKECWSNFTTWASELWNKCKEEWIAKWNESVEGCKELANKLVTKVKESWGSFTTWVSDKWNGMVSDVIGFFTRLGNKIQETASTIVTNVKNAFGKVFDFITYPFKKAWEFISGIGDKIGGVLAKLNPFKSIDVNMNPVDGGEINPVPSFKIPDDIALSGNYFNSKTLGSTGLQTISQVGSIKSDNDILDIETILDLFTMKIAKALTGVSIENNFAVNVDKNGIVQEVKKSFGKESNIRKKIRG